VTEERIDQARWLCSAVSDASAARGEGQREKKKYEGARRWRYGVAEFPSGEAFHLVPSQGGDDPEILSPCKRLLIDTPLIRDYENILPMTPGTKGNWGTEVRQTRHVQLSAARAVLSTKQLVVGPGKGHLVNAEMRKEIVKPPRRASGGEGWRRRVRGPW